MDDSAPGLAASRPLYCRVVALADATPDIRIVRLTIVHGGAFRFRAGQYARLTMGSCPPRDYSMASRPDDPFLEFHIRHANRGGASAYAGRTLREGEGVWVEGPFGDAYWRAEHGGPILCVAGGSGLAPITSIVETALAAGVRREIRVYAGARREADLYLEERFRNLERRFSNLRFTVLLSEPDGPTSRRRGSPVNAIALDVPRADGLKAYLAGPPAMVDAAIARLVEAGVSLDDIHADPFYSDRTRRAATPAFER